MTGIQRVVSEGRKYVLLSPVLHNNVHNLHPECEVCESRVKRGARWCSLGCKVAVAEGGRRLLAAQRLVALAEGGHFAPAAHHYSCPDHSRHQHPLPPPESMTVVRFEGWAAVPAGQLPAAYVENVQV
ncbi:hypothetical protein HU200_021248 [Digitaria exilis]|uniref:Uncharacterized protein n=1 Tax=Digitaria exilis TaxID=1010633 RepID=A0A835F095_9POAL|nr:hypothetical protein HU200_021248 [Digitaria exilis]